MDRRKKLEEHRDNGDYCINSDITDYSADGVGGSEAEGADVADEYLTGEAIEDPEGGGGAGEAEEDQGGAVVGAFYEGYEGHEGGSDNCYAGFQAIVAGGHVEGVGGGHYAEGDDEGPEQKKEQVEAPGGEAREIDSSEDEVETGTRWSEEDHGCRSENDQCGFSSSGKEPDIVYETDYGCGYKDCHRGLKGEDDVFVLVEEAGEAGDYEHGQ